MLEYTVYIEEKFPIRATSTSSLSPVPVAMEPSITALLCGLAACFFGLASADAGPVGSLFAYGKNISGLPLIYADGGPSRKNGLWCLPMN